MAILIFIIVFASLFVVLLMAASLNQETYGEAYPFLYVLSGIMLILTIVFVFLGMQRVPDNHIRILSRSGEPFKVLDEGQHYVAEFVPYQSTNFSCRPRISSYIPGQDTIIDGAAKWAEIGKTRETSFYVKSDFLWNLNCDKESALRAYNIVARNKDRVKIEDKLFQSHVVPFTHQAIQRCQPAVTKTTTPEDVKRYYEKLGEKCVRRFIAQKSKTISVHAIGNWDVRYSPS